MSCALKHGAKVVNNSGLPILYVEFFYISRFAYSEYDNGNGWLVNKYPYMVMSLKSADQLADATQCAYSQYFISVNSVGWG